MALKAYVNGVLGVGPGYPGTAETYTQGVVFENGALIVDGTNTAVVFTGYGLVTVSDAFASLRAKVQADFENNFNLLQGRTDGHTINFYWLDAKGLLGL